MLNKMVHKISITTTTLIISSRMAMVTLMEAMMTTEVVEMILKKEKGVIRKIIIMDLETIIPIQILDLRAMMLDSMVELELMKVPEEETKDIDLI